MVKILNRLTIMKQSHRRKVKQQVGNLLQSADGAEALRIMEKIPPEKLTNHLFSYFYAKSELIKFRSVTAMGLMTARLEKLKIERVRNILRRIMWNLNDESGGIGWGSAEAMGEILSYSPRLGREFASILFSYLDPGGTYIEHEKLQLGVIWGIGSYLRVFPDKVPTRTVNCLMHHLNSADPTKRIYALRTLLFTGCFKKQPLPAHVLEDNQAVELFSHWHFQQVTPADLLKENR